jgi:hypothetical protein
MGTVIFPKRFLLQIHKPDKAINVVGVDHGHRQYAEIRLMKTTMGTRLGNRAKRRPGITMHD